MNTDEKPIPGLRYLGTVEITGTWLPEPLTDREIASLEKIAGGSYLAGVSIDRLVAELRRLREHAPHGCFVIVGDEEGGA